MTETRATMVGAAVASVAAAIYLGFIAYTGAWGPIPEARRQCGKVTLCSLSR